MGTGGDTTNATTTYSYDPTSKLLTGMLYTDTTGAYNITHAYTYDNYKRLNSSVETTPTIVYTRETQFDVFGRALKERYKALNTSNSKIQINGFVILIKMDIIGKFLMMFQVRFCGRQLL